jgi:putative ABC transport system ATP-binding protein
MSRRQAARQVPLGATSADGGGGGVEVLLDLVSRRFGQDRTAVVALDSVSLKVAPGESVALMGRSGSGKSTLLHLVGALDHPTSGRICVGRRRVDLLAGADAARYRREVGFVFQRFHLIPVLSALENVLAPLIPTGVGAEEQRRARGLLEAVGLGAQAAHLPSELSGGEQQRVAIARALVNRPRLFLADEPTGNLDTQTGQAVVQLLLSLRESEGATLILVTHDADIAARCERVLRLTDGRIDLDEPLA